jgi:predicted amidohydrolase
MSGTGTVTMRVAMVQARSLGQVAANLEHAAELTEQAAVQGAAWWCYPNCSAAAMCPTAAIGTWRSPAARRSGRPETAGTRLSSG